MIQLTKLNGISILVNPDLIRTIESAPDTLLKFIDGETLMVRETPREVINFLVAFRRECARGPSASEPDASSKESPAWT